MTGVNPDQRVWDALLKPWPDWRELERRRVASGVPISRVSWTCSHVRGVFQDKPERARSIPHVWRRWRREA